jgi:beta-galactosidase
MSFGFDLYINKGTWKLVSVDSQQGGNEAKLAFDGNNSTFWHTPWGNNEPQHPHTLIVDMVKEYSVTAFTYLARQDGSENGMVKGYEVYLSKDGETWGTAVASGEFAKTTSLQVAKLKKKTVGRYLKFVAKSEINCKAWTSAAEIGIQAEADVTGIGAMLNDKGKMRNDARSYDLQGRRVTAQPTKKGLYISKGKKVLR